MVEWNETEHVLHGRDPAAQRLQRADERARPHLLPAAVLPHRDGVEEPHFERQLLEQTAAQRIVGMVMRIYQTGDHQPSRGIDQVVLAVRSEIGADRGNPVAFDQNIGDAGAVDIPVVIVDLSAPDQQLCRA